MYLKSTNALLAKFTKYLIKFKSYSVFFESYLCWTFTATYYPVFNWALWTCPIDALEIGAYENVTNKSEIFIPVSS